MWLGLPGRRSGSQRSSRFQKRSWPIIIPMYPTWETSPQKGLWIMSEQTQLMFSLAEPPIRDSVSQDSEKEWMTTVLTWRSSSLELLGKHARPGWSGKTSLASFQRTEEGTSVPSSEGWKNSGMGSPGESLMLNTSGCHKDADVSFLSDILEETGDHLLRYYLSEKACKGILRRAEKRGKELPKALKMALEKQSAYTPTKEHRESEVGI